MKVVLGSLAMMAALTAGAVNAQTAPSMTSKEQWACEVAMCLANPQGPTAVAECRPPIQKMQRELAKGHAIPKCKFLGGSSNSGGGGKPGGGGDNEHAREQQK